MLVIEPCGQVADEPDLHPLSEHELEDLLRVSRPDDQVHVREGRLEATEDERQHVRRDRGRGADLELADAALAKLAQEQSALGERLDGSLGVGAKGAALRRQPHPSRGSDEELDPELPLEVLDPGRQRGLRDVEDGRRLGHRAALRDAEEGLDLAEQHSRRLSMR